MSERFKYYFASQIIKDNKTGQRYYGNKLLAELLNELHEKNIDLHIQNDFLKAENQHMRDLMNENEQLKQDNNALIHSLENQSMIIQELHSKLLEYQVKEPIVLTKEDLELMDKAISYYTHGRCGE